MKYAIAISGEGLDAKIDSHFARCHYFALYDSIEQSLSFIPNPFFNLTARVGPTVVKFLYDNGVEVVISQQFGEKIKSHFYSLNMGMVIPESAFDKKLKDIIDILKNNTKIKK